MKYRVHFKYDGRDDFVDVNRSEETSEPIVLDVIADKLNIAITIPAQREGAAAPNYTELLRKHFKGRLEAVRVVALIKP